MTLHSAFHVAKSPEAFIPDIQVKHLTLSQVLAGETLKEIHAQQRARYTGPYTLPPPAPGPRFSAAQIQSAKNLPIPLETTAHTAAPSYPVVTHPVKSLEMEVGLTLILVMVLYGFLAIWHDRRLDAEIRY